MAAGRGGAEGGAGRARGCVNFPHNELMNERLFARRGGANRDESERIGAGRQVTPEGDKRVTL
jgi:hypothetical protein